MSKLLLNTLLSVVFVLIAMVVLLILTPPCSLSKLKLFTEQCLNISIANNEDYDQQIQELENRVAQLRTGIVGKECSLNSFVTIQSDQPDETRLTKKELEGFENADLTNLAGCWEFVGSSQTFYPVGCKLQGNCEENKRISSNAEYCFDESGSGQATTDFANGSCRASTIAEFNQNSGQSPILNFTETSDAFCDGGVGSRAILARSYSCKLSDDNRIKCSTIYSAQGAGSDIVLKRKNNGQQ